MADHSGLQLGNYRLTKRLGSGGFAEVYLAQHIYLNTFFAVKIFNSSISEEYTPDFLREARIIAALDHPHIIPVSDCGVEKHIPFLVMKYATGGALNQRYPKGTRIDSRHIVHYTAQIASALQYAHNKKIIHRDIKPGNILLGNNDSLYLSDFGIALLSQTTKTSPTTRDIVGTPLYMAPEQFTGKPSKASDQYSLGIVVYEWICGERPFQGMSHEVYNQHLYTAPPSLRERASGLPQEVEQVVFRALEKDPKKRFDNVQTFSDALTEAYRRQPSPSKTRRVVVQSSTTQPTAKNPVLVLQDPLPTPKRTKVKSHSLLGILTQHTNKSESEEKVTNQSVLEQLRDALTWFIMVLETALAIRFLLKLLGADPSNLFAGLLYTLTDIVLFPFSNIVRAPSIHTNQAFEWSTLIAMVIYWLVFWAIQHFLLILTRGPDDYVP